MLGTTYLQMCCGFLIKGACGRVMVLLEMVSGMLWRGGIDFLMYCVRTIQPWISPEREIMEKLKDDTDIVHVS